MSMVTRIESKNGSKIGTIPGWQRGEILECYPGYL